MPTVARPVRWRLVPVSVGFAVLVSLWAQIGLFLTTPGWSFFTFRSYYPYDQLSYLAIVKNASEGDFRAVEPFTLTGSNYYPRAYYQMLGVISDALGIAPVTAWNLVAVVFQVGLVVVIALTCVLVTRRWWAAALAPLPLMVGTLSLLFALDWKSELGSHAVLWGPFGTLFVANGEAAALCVAGVALLLVLLVALGKVPPRLALPTAIVACALIGALSAVQTYSFLTATFLLSYGAGVYGLALARRRWLVVVSAAMVVLVFLLGPTVAETVSPLAALVFGATPAIPGLVVLCKRLRWLPVWCAVALLATALPQTLGTVLGVASGDEFLVYREASSKDLGIPLLGGLRAAAVPLLGLVLLSVVAIRRRSTVHAAVGLGGIAAWGMVATNDVWGANQEPYRFWIDAFTLLSVVLLPLLLDLWTGAGAVRDDGSADRAPLAALSPRERKGYRMATAAVSALAILSLMDFAQFRSAVSATGPLDFSTEQSAALVRSAQGVTTDGIVLPGPCVDAFTLKLEWGGPTAFYNLGLAWPEERDAVQAARDARDAGTLDVDAAREAGIDWVITDSACTTAWELPVDSGVVTETRSVDYPGGTYTLWRIEPA